jgi:ornithine cyclodeaminase
LAKIGSHQELEFEILLQVDKLVVDYWDYVSRRGKEVITLMEKGVFSRNNVYAELPEIVAGKKTSRENDEEKILLIALGSPAKYGEAAPYVYSRAVELGVGRLVPQIW